MYNPLQLPELRVFWGPQVPHSAPLAGLAAREPWPLQSHPRGAPIRGGSGGILMQTSKQSRRQGKHVTCGLLLAIEVPVPSHDILSNFRLELRPR